MHCGNSRANQLVHRHFQTLVERRRGLVEEHRLRLGQQDAGERHPLLFAGREHLGPVLLLVEAIDEVRQCNLDERLLKLRRPECRRAQRDTTRPRADRPAARTAIGTRTSSRSRHRDGAACPSRTATAAPGCATAWSCRCPTRPVITSAVAGVEPQIQWSKSVARRRECGPRRRRVRRCRLRCPRWRWWAAARARSLASTSPCEPDDRGPERRRTCHTTFRKNDSES